jgi:hypothetical protein
MKYIIAELRKDQGPAGGCTEPVQSLFKTCPNNNAAVDCGQEFVTVSEPSNGTCASHI